MKVKFENPSVSGISRLYPGFRLYIPGHAIGEKAVVTDVPEEHLENVREYLKSSAPVITVTELDETEGETEGATEGETEAQAETKEPEANNGEGSTDDQGADEGATEGETEAQAEEATIPPVKVTSGFKKRGGR